MTLLFQLYRGTLIIPESRSLLEPQRGGWLLHEETVYPARVSNPRRLRTFSQVAAATAAVVLTVSGCGVRVGQPPSPIPTPDAVESHRQSAAVAMERILLAADAAPGKVPDGLVPVVTEYLDDLGGVWIPPGRDDNPFPASPALAQDNSDLAGVLAEAGDLMLTLANSGDNPAAYTSMWLSLYTAQMRIEGDQVRGCTIPCGDGIIPTVFAIAREQGENHDLVGLLDLLHESAPDLIAAYDALGYLEEVRAARGNNDVRDALEPGATVLREFADFLAGSAAGSDADPRLNAYQFNPDDIEASIRGYIDEALDGWLAVLTAAAAAGDVRAATAAKSAVWFTYGSTNPDLQIELWPGFGLDN